MSNAFRKSKYIKSITFVILVHWTEIFVLLVLSVDTELKNQYFIHLQTLFYTNMKALNWNNKIYTKLDYNKNLRLVDVPLKKNVNGRLHIMPVYLYIYTIYLSFYLSIHIN